MGYSRTIEKPAWRKPSIKSLFIGQNDFRLFQAAHFSSCRSMKPPSVALVVLADPPSRPAFVLGNFGQSRPAPGIGDMGIDNGDAPARLHYLCDKFARLIQVIKEATAEDRIEDTILPEIADIVTREVQVGQMGPSFDSLTILKIALPNLDAQHLEASARQFDAIATLQASQIDNPFTSGAIRKHQYAETAW